MALEVLFKKKNYFSYMLPEARKHLWEFYSVGGQVLSLLGKNLQF